MIKYHATIFVPQISLMPKYPRETTTFRHLEQLSNTLHWSHQFTMISFDVMSTSVGAGEVEKLEFWNNTEV